MKMKMKKKNSVLEQVKAARKQSREEEIKTHGKTINYQKVLESKKQYNRKKNKADDEVLPYLFFICLCQGHSIECLSWDELPDAYPFGNRNKHRITGFDTESVIPCLNLW